MLWLIEEDNRQWIREVWSHYRKSHRDGGYQRTRFWACVRVTIALILDLYVDDDPRAQYEAYQVAWQRTGRYMTDYGEGTSFDVLAVIGFRYMTWSDGDL
jgi:hypothetical protein